MFSLSFMLSTFYIDSHDSSAMNYVDEKPIVILILFLLLSNFWRCCTFVAMNELNPIKVPQWMLISH